ncbi:TetR/AcrR family transcriptional regulator [Nocardioides sp. L-11A]|uniref:TetR/AcrR family transcriptional regulator n=1 Tax=Nocardioides sp. L-11A TaxID=3043848 RepID=UPI00249C7598|nr:helix-turn-helix domain-containing protein [Nocardioides sp. L-11A]
MAEVKRRYHSPLRSEQAEASRAAVLRAARELFVEQGYGRTTVEQVAARAGVSKPTVFTAVGNKATLLKVVRDVALAGDDDPRAVSERDDVAAIAAAGDLARAITLTARHVVAVNARYDDVHEVIRGASGADPAVAALWETSEAERHVGAGHLLARLHATPALPVRRAQDRLWLLMAPDHYHRLVVVQGWSRSAYEQWLIEGIRSLFDA